VTGCYPERVAALTARIPFWTAVRRLSLSLAGALLMTVATDPPEGGLTWSWVGILAAFWAVLTLLSIPTVWIYREHSAEENWTEIDRLRRDRRRRAARAGA
jgi:hypothetical protein